MNQWNTPPHNSAENDNSQRSRPSWYSDSRSDTSSTNEGDAAQNPPSEEGMPRNPYADQPLSGPWGDGSGQNTVAGDYPVIANQPGQQSWQHHQQYPGNYPGYGQGGYGGYGGYGATEPKGLSIASMVLGIVSVVTVSGFFVAPIVGVILGHIGMSKEPAGRGFAIAGLIMNYLVIAFWVFISVVFFAFLGSVDTYY